MREICTNCVRGLVVWTRYIRTLACIENFVQNFSAKIASKKTGNKTKKIKAYPRFVERDRWFVFLLPIVGPSCGHDLKRAQSLLAALHDESCPCMIRGAPTSISLPCGDTQFFAVALALEHARRCCHWVVVESPTIPHSTCCAFPPPALQVPAAFLDHVQ